MSANRVNGWNLATFLPNADQAGPSFPPSSPRTELYGRDSARRLSRATTTCLIKCETLMLNLPVKTDEGREGGADRSDAGPAAALPLPTYLPRPVLPSSLFSMSRTAANERTGSGNSSFSPPPTERRGRRIKERGEERNEGEKEDEEGNGRGREGGRPLPSLSILASPLRGTTATGATSSLPSHPPFPMREARRRSSGGGGATNEREIHLANSRW